MGQRALVRRPGLLGFARTGDVQLCSSDPEWVGQALGVGRRAVHCVISVLPTSDFGKCRLAKVLLD